MGGQYTFVGNGPVSGRDPFGLQSLFRQQEDRRADRIKREFQTLQWQVDSLRTVRDSLANADPCRNKGSIGGLDRQINNLLRLQKILIDGSFKNRIWGRDGIETDWTTTFAVGGVTTAGVYGGLRGGLGAFAEEAASEATGLPINGNALREKLADTLADAGEAGAKLARSVDSSYRFNLFGEGEANPNYVDVSSEARWANGRPMTQEFPDGSAERILVRNAPVTGPNNPNTLDEITRLSRPGTQIDIVNDPANAESQSQAVIDALGGNARVTLDRTYTRANRIDPAGEPETVRQIRVEVGQ